MNGLNLTAYVSWILSCIRGAILAQWIAHPEVLGLDFALPSMFMALLVLQLQNILPEKLAHYIKLIAYVVIVMMICSLFVPTHVAVLLSIVIVATIGVVTDR